MEFGTRNLKSLLIVGLILGLLSLLMFVMYSRNFFSVGSDVSIRIHANEIANSVTDANKNRLNVHDTAIFPKIMTLTPSLASTSTPGINAVETQSPSNQLDSFESQLSVDKIFSQIASISSTQAPSLASSFSPESSKFYKFLGRRYNPSKWAAIRSALNCISSRGQWVDKGNLNHHAKLFDYGCSGNRYSEGECTDRSRPGLRYAWEMPNSNICSEYTEFNHNNWSHEVMCDLIENLHIFLLGDSIQDEFFITLWSAMHPKEAKSNTCHVRGGSQHCTSAQSSSPRSYILDSDRHDYFLTVDEKGQFIKYDNHPYCHSNDCSVYFGREWYRQLAKVKQDSGKDIDLMVVNRGAHYVEDDHVIAELRQTLRWMQTNHPNVSIMFRSTGPGHAYCDVYFNAAPLPPSDYFVVSSSTTNPATFETTNASLNATFEKRFYDEQARTYNWDKFHVQNKKVQRLLEEEFPEVLFLDIFPSAVLRPDSHCVMNKRDCLHYCIPGPIDNWVILFYHALQLLKKFA